MVIYSRLINILLLVCLAICAKASASQVVPVRGMISGNLGRGRADVFHNGLWGSIGNTNWDDEDANVFCRNLGFSSGMAIPSSEIYNTRKTIWLDNLDCKGNETSLDQCGHLGWNKTIVNKKKPASEIIAGVQCYGDLVRINSNKNEGVAEIFKDGKWGTIAAENWEDKDAQVFCSMLGYRMGKATKLPSVSIIYKDVNCAGDETSILQCQHTPNPECINNNLIAGVKCIGDKVRIVGGEKKGRAEIFYNGQWGTICDSPGNNDAATIFCRMLGFWTGRFPSQAKTKSDLQTPIWAQEFSCTGNETTLAQCGYKNLMNTTCSHDDDIEVSCSNVHVRIMKNARAEVFFNGQYLPICSNIMTVPVAQVFCRTLGLEFEQIVSTETVSTNTIHLVNMSCNGDEDDIQQCRDIKWSTLGCGKGHSDALLICSGDIAVEGDANEVQLVHNRKRGVACADGWDQKDTTVFCRMMGYREGSHSKVTWRTDYSDFHITNVGCYGNEFNLYQCPYELLTDDLQKCNNNNEVAVASCTGSLVRIVGKTEKKGRAEIFYNGTWGTICSDYWDDTSATVFCKMLGYSNGVMFDPYDSGVEENTGPIWLSDVTCTGEEKNILQCGHTDWEDHQCIHDYDTGVECSKD